MAIVKLNPIIISISGRIGDIVFYMRKNTICVRSYVIPRNPDTKAQRTVRLRFALAIKSWQDMSGDEKYSFSRKARNLNMSGYNLYISGYMREGISSVPERQAKQAYLSGAYSPGIQRRIHSVSYPNKQAFPKVMPVLPVINSTG